MWGVYTPRPDYQSSPNASAKAAISSKKRQPINNVPITNSFVLDSLRGQAHHFKAGDACWLNFKDSYRSLIFVREDYPIFVVEVIPLDLGLKVYGVPYTLLKERIWDHPRLIGGIQGI